MFLNAIGRECSAEKGICQFYLKQNSNVQGRPHGGRGREGGLPLTGKFRWREKEHHPSLSEGGEAENLIKSKLGYCVGVCPF